MSWGMHSMLRMQSMAGRGTNVMRNPSGRMCRWKLVSLRDEIGKHHTDRLPSRPRLCVLLLSKVAQAGLNPSTTSCRLARTECEWGDCHQFLARQPFALRTEGGVLWRRNMTPRAHGLLYDVTYRVGVRFKGEGGWLHQ